MLKGIVKIMANSSDLQDRTKRDYRLVIKRFFSWLKEFVSWIRVSDTKSSIGPNDILSELELNKLRNSCRNLRDLIECLHATACRSHEFLSLRRSDVMFTNYEVVVYIRKNRSKKD